MQAMFGIVFLLFIAWLVSEQRRAFPWRFVISGVAVHFALAALLLRLPIIRDILSTMGRGLELLSAATQTATGFVFGYIGGGDLPFTVTNTDALLVLAFQILPQILVLSVLFALFWHWGLLQLFVRGFAYLLERALGISGALGLGAAGNVFLGMVESPMMIRPYLAQMQRQDLFALMTCGMATISGTIMVVYGIILQGVVADPFGHVLTASIIAVPAALLIARIMAPIESSMQTATLTGGARYSSSMDAIMKGAQAGLQVVVSVITMLIVFVALVALVNIMLLGLFGEVGGSPLTLERMLGWAFAPIAWAMGIPFEQAMTGGKLLGMKVILTEFVALTELARLPEGSLDARGYVIMLYGLTGFANLASLGVLVGGMTSMLPEQRQNIIKYAPRAVFAGTLASCLSGAVVGLLLWLLG